MATKTPFGGYEGLWAGMSQFSGVLRKSNIENLGRLPDSIARAIESRVAVAEIVGRKTQMLSSLNIPSYTKPLAFAAVKSSGVCYHTLLKHVGHQKSYPYDSY